MIEVRGRNLRVLFLVNLFPPDYTGGAEVINYHTCQALIERGVECSILVVYNRSLEPADEHYEFEGLPVRRVGFHTTRRRALTDVFDWRVYRAVTRELRQLQPHIVHMHNSSGATLAPFQACRSLGVPVVSTLHDLWLLCPNNMLYRRDGSFCDPAQNPNGCNKCFRKYDFWADIPFRRSVFAALTSNVRFFISPSSALARLHEEAGYNAERFRVVPHGLATVATRESGHPVIEEFIHTGGQFRTIVFAGGGIEIKGANVLLEAIPLILRHLDRLRIVVAGGGEERLIARFRQHAPYVHLLGRVPFGAMSHLYAAADLVLVPSTCPESFSLVTLESLQVGTPVVGSDFGGIPELIREGETGYLFPVGNATALAERIIHHFARPAHVRRQMRHMCLEDVRTRFTLERHVQGTIQVYREALVS